jgi:hypothetical protein
VDRTGKIKDLNRDLDESDLVPIQHFNLTGYEPPAIAEMSLATLPEPPKSPTVQIPEIKETVREFLDRKREILYVKMDIQNKEEETRRLDEFI